MGGLYMRVNFYKSVLEEKIKQLEPSKNFLSQCCELMGYLQPGQLLDRYAALNHVFKELYREYDDRISMMNKLQERLSDIKSETDHRNMLMHNEMSDLHMNLKALTTGITYMEFELHERMDQCTGAEMELYNIKNSIHRSYVSLMLYRGLEPTDTDPFVQLDHIATRIKTTQEVIRMIREENQRRDFTLRRFRREKDGDQPLQASESISSLETVDDNENRQDFAPTQDANCNLWPDDASWVRAARGNPANSPNRSRYGCALPHVKGSLTCGLTGRNKSNRGSRFSSLTSQRRYMKKLFGVSMNGQSQKKTNPSSSPIKNDQNVTAPFVHLPKILEQENVTSQSAYVNFCNPDQIVATCQSGDGDNHEPQFGGIKSGGATRRSRGITQGGKCRGMETGPRLPEARVENEARPNHNSNKAMTMTKDRETPQRLNKMTKDRETPQWFNKMTKDFLIELETGNVVINSGRIGGGPPRILDAKEKNVNALTPCQTRPPDVKKLNTLPKNIRKTTKINQKLAGKISTDKVRLCSRRGHKTCADNTKKTEQARDDGVTNQKVEPPWLCRREKLRNYLEILYRCPVGAQQTVGPD